MELKMYAIKDSKGGVFGPIVLFKQHGEAERELKIQAQNKNSRIALTPEDYDLYHLGHWDDVTGKFNSFDTPQHIAKAIDLIN